MIETEKILQTKISSRIIRRSVIPNKKIEKILSDVCLAFNIEKPKLLFCDTLTRRISSFEFRGIRYIVFDSSLFEYLFLYDKLIISDTDIADVDKLYYKILYEECLFQEFPLALPCYQMYKSKTFSFNNQFDDEANEYISCQSYFLLLHEIVHFDIGRNKVRKDFLEFKENALQCFFHLMKNYSASSYIKEGLSAHFGVDIDETGENFVYSTVMKKLDAFLEECFCDYQAFKFICKTSASNNTKVSASYTLLSFLITSEIIRNSFGIHAITLNKEVNESLFTSYLRLHLFTLIVYFSKLDIEGKLLESCQKIENRYSAILEDINSLPQVPINIDLKEMLIKISREYIFGDD